MTIKSDGKVGINTTSPLGLLHVADPRAAPAIYISGANTEEGDYLFVKKIRAGLTKVLRGVKVVIGSPVVAIRWVYRSLQKVYRKVRSKL